MSDLVTMTQTDAREVCRELSDYSPRIELEGNGTLGAEGWIVRLYVPHLGDVYTLRDPHDLDYFRAEVNATA